MKIFNDKKFIRMEVIRLAQRGRKPKPTAVKQLEGNPGKRQLNANEPKPAARAPSCPKWLEDDAKKEWRRLAKQMEQLGILTLPSLCTLERGRRIYIKTRCYCQNSERILAASAAGIYCSAVYETDEQVL